ncbi:MAG: class I SAM-dependent RNA methyltransferase [Lachnospiraceae bacterium]|nr:class I SAM-dependent RNA methyltransferase [Lachnospiraceae bacterium]
MQYRLLSPCHFGLEAVLKREIADIGLNIDRVEDGRVYYSGDETAIARANMFLRTTERVLLLVGEFEARTYDELFENTKALNWSDLMPEDANFYVTKAASIKSRLFSPSDIQRIVGKAIVESMKGKYRTEYFSKSGFEYPVRVTINKDRVTVSIDTSGESLHKRGYRRLTAKAPITETLAAAIIMLTPWKADRILVDPFCGSGTFPIEAALIGAGIAPGRNRSFAGQNHVYVPAKTWKDALDEAVSLEKRDVEMQIRGYDIDPEIVKAARQNAKLAGVDGYIHFQQQDMRELSSQKQYGFVITNPPYGERLEEKAALPHLYKAMGEAFGKLKNWSYFFITSYEDAEKYFGRKADKNRKIYNGMIRTYLYEYYGPKPPKKESPANIIPE